MTRKIVMKPEYLQAESGRPRPEYSKITWAACLVCLQEPALPPFAGDLMEVAFEGTLIDVRCWDILSKSLQISSVWQ